MNTFKRFLEYVCWILKISKWGEKEKQDKQKIEIIFLMIDINLRRVAREV